MGKFHSRDGFCFQRLGDGSVRITKELHGSIQGDGPFVSVDVVAYSTVLPENEWASVVASVSAKGETGATWEEARHYHQGV